MRQTFWILIAFSAIGAALNPNELDEASCFELNKRLEADALELPFRLEKHVKNLLVLLSPSCQSNGLELVQQIYSLAEDSEGLEAPALVDRDGTPTASAVIGATLERILGFSNRITSMGGSDDGVDSVLEGLRKAAADPQFELWRTSDLLRHLEGRDDVVNVDQAREVIFRRAVDMFPRDDNTIDGLVESQLDSPTPLPSSMTSKIPRFLNRLSDLSLVKLFQKLRTPETIHLIPSLLEKLDPERFATVTDTLNCVNPADSIEKYICLPIAKAKGELQNAVEWTADVIQNFSSPHPLWRPQEHYPFLVSALGLENQAWVTEAAKGIVHASPMIRKFYGVRYVMDTVCEIEETMEQVRRLADEFAIMKKVANMCVLRGVYIKLRNSPSNKQLDVVSELLKSSLLRTAYGGFFETHPRFTEKIFQLIVSAANTISTSLRWRGRILNIKPNSRFKVKFVGHFASRAPHASLIPLGDDAFYVCNMPVRLPLRLKSMRGEDAVVTIKRATEQRLSKLASIIPPRATQFPRAFTEALAKEFRAQIDFLPLRRLFDFEIVRNPTTISEVRLEAARRLITVDPQELAQLRREPRQLSWFGERAGQIAYQDIFKHDSAYELIDSLEKIRESHPGYYRYWSKFLARGVAEYYASSELRLNKEFSASGVGKKEEFEQLWKDTFLLGHRRVLMKNYGRGTLFRIRPRNAEADARILSTLDCQIVNELNNIWRGFCNVPFALICTRSKQLEASNKLEQADTLSRDESSTQSKEARKTQAETLRKEAQKLTAEQLTIWRSVFAHITEDGIAKALEEVPQEFFSAFEAIPIQSDVWKYVAEGLKGITSLEQEVLADRKLKLYKFAVNRTTDVTPWLAAAALEIDYPNKAKEKNEFKKTLILIASKFTDPLSDPLTPHGGIKRVRELLFEQFDPLKKIPAAAYNWKTIIKATSNDMLPVLTPIALRVLEALPETEMANLMSAQPITLLMSAQVKNATKAHWDKFLAHLRYKPVNMKTVMEKLDTAQSWSKFMSITSLEDQETVIKLVSSGLPSMAHLCTELSGRLTSTKYAPSCSSDSMFFQLLRLIAVIDAEEAGFEKCLEIKYKAFSSLGRACNILTHPSADPLEPLRHLQFERTNEQKVTETKVPVDNFWPPRVMRTLYAAFFSIYENREFASKTSYLETKASIMGPETISVVKGILGAANRQTLGAANRFARLQWYQHRLRHAEEDLSLWRFASARPFFGVRFVPKAPAIQTDYRVRLLLVEASKLLVEELEVETRAYDKRMNICELKALSPIEGSNPPPYDRTFEESMRRRHDKMIQHIENNDYRTILYLARQYNSETDAEVSTKLLAGPGRLRDIVSRYAGPEQTKKIIAWIVTEIAKEPPVTKERVAEILRSAFLSRGFNAEMQGKAHEYYPHCFEAPGSATLVTGGSPSLNAPPFGPPGMPPPPFGAPSGPPPPPFGAPSGPPPPPFGAPSGPPPPPPPN